MSARERVFRLLLRLYPAPFRIRYGAELLQVCLDELRDAAAPGARRGQARTLAGNLLDVAWNGLVERVTNGRAPAPTPAMRLLGTVGVAGGLILVSGFLLFIPGNFNVARLVLFNAGAVVVTVAVTRLARHRLGLLSVMLAAFVVGANVAYAVGTLYTAQFEHPFASSRGVLYAWLTMAMWLSDGLFGLVALRLGGLARLGGLSLALGGLAILGMDRLWEPTELAGMIAMTGVLLNGVGWIVLGLIVALRGRDESARVGAPGPA